MQDIFQDPEFDKFLYGGVNDLDEPVGRLVYNLHRAKIRTAWSCSGQIHAKFSEDAGGLALPEHFIYQPGLLFYFPDRQADILTEKLEAVVKENTFALLDKRKDMNYLILEMADLAVSIDPKLLRPGLAKKQIPRSLAERRYADFLKIWSELTDWSEDLSKGLLVDKPFQ